MRAKSAVGNCAGRAAARPATVEAMRVIDIWRFPVKSVGGESLVEVDVGELGISGDRCWSIYDAASGTTLTARRTPELLLATARIVDGELRMKLPDGSTVGEDGHRELSSWLGREVELRAGSDGDPEVGGTYEVPLDFENDTEWVSWQGPGGAFHDSKWSRVSLVSTATIGDWDIRRFRTNIVVDGDGEDAFVGRHLRIGEAAELAVFKQIDRCVMVTRPQPGLERDIELLKTINSERASFLAIGCLVAEPGLIAVGDAVRPTT